MLGQWLKRCHLMCNGMHGQSAANCYHCFSKRFLRTSQNWRQKSSERHDPQQINLMQGHSLKRYKLNWKEMQRQSATTCYHCSSKRLLRTSRNWKQNSQRGLNLRISNLMLGHWLKRCHLMCNEMHGHSAAKCYHCLSKRFLRTSENWRQKSSERHDPQQTNLMLRYCLKHDKLKWNEVHRQSATKFYPCLSKRFVRTSNNWKQESQKDTIHRKSISCSTLNHVLKKELKPNSRKVS